MLALVFAALAQSETEQGNAVDNNTCPTPCYRNFLIGTIPGAEPPLSRLLEAIVGGFNDSGML